MKRKLDNVTLIGVDCVDVERLQKALDISCQGIDFANVKLLTSLATDNPRKVEIPHLDTIEAYSKFCIRDLYKYVDTDFILLVQHDGFILNPEKWDDAFLDYDYIGSPWLIADWSVAKFDIPKILLGKIIVGNGGFSLRSKKLLQTTSQLADKGVFKRYNPEDIAFCIWYRKEVEAAGIQFAPPEIAERFGFEGEENVYNKQFGFHGLKYTDISEWIKKNPQWGIQQIPKKMLK
jgi:hypothetical protein